MNSQSARKKSINLILIIIILILLLFLVFIIIKFLNNKSDESNDINNTENVSLTLNITDENQTSYNHINNLDDFQSINTLTNSTQSNNNLDTSDNNNVTTNPTPTPTPTSTPNAESTVTISNHTYALPNTIKYSKISNEPNKDCLLLQYPNFEFEMVYNTYKLNFKDLKSNSSLRSYLESTFNISISGNLKSGNLKNLDIIACSISENSKPGYFIVTPLNDSEIIYVKIFNTIDSTKLVSDLSDPLEAIGKLKTYLKN